MPSEITNTLVVRVEDGDLSYEEHTGSWISEESLRYLTSVFSEELAGLYMEPGADAAIEMSKGELPRVFLITLYDPVWGLNEGYWDYDYGYVSPENYLEWGKVDVQELTD